MPDRFVGFEWGSPDLPVALGGLYNKTDAPPAGAIDKDNNIKLFQSRSGHQVILDDADGKEKISIVAKDGSTVVMNRHGARRISPWTGSFS